MKIDTVRLAYFSPTGTTRKVVESIAGAIGVDDIQHIDITRPAIKTKELEEITDGLAIIGAPVYAGRLPPEAVNRLRKLKASSVPVVVVVLYGNREYDDALIELRDLAEERGFTPVAGGAFIGEHSFNSEEIPIAPGRPDEVDLEKARAFGQMIKERLDGIGTLGNIPRLVVPGNVPYRELRRRRHIPPVTDESLCMMCATCLSVCPTGAITINGDVVTDPDACIVCCACIKNCPTGARRRQDPMSRRISGWLVANTRERKEPVTFIVSK